MAVQRVGSTLFSNDCVRQHHLFAERNPRFVELLNRDVQVEVFRPGEIIMKEGAKGNSMYILRKGKVEVLAGGNSVAQLTNGSVFGEILLLGAADRRTATIRAIEFSDCRVVSRKHMQRLLQLFPHEKTFFEQLARERVQGLKQQQVVHAPAGTSVHVKLPPVKDEGLTETAEYASAMSAISHFFEKQSPKAVRLKKNLSLQQNSHVVDDLIALKPHQPKLPPLITRKSPLEVWKSEQEAGRSEAAPTSACAQDLHLDAQELETAVKAHSSRSSSPPSPSPRRGRSQRKKHERSPYAVDDQFADSNRMKAGSLLTQATRDGSLERSMMSANARETSSPRTAAS